MPNERFLKLDVVQRELSLSIEDALSLIKTGELPAISLVGSWRIERSVLEQFICRLYARTAATLREHGAMYSDHEEPNSQESHDADETSYEMPGGHNIDLPRLTPQMRRVWELVARGLSNAEIASELTLEVSTVKSHVSRLLSRLGIRNRESLIAFAWSLGQIPSEARADPPPGPRRP
jgi:DNA-binding NarL/FixJ family response regulator